jgi:hypothetical protein
MWWILLVAIAGVMAYGAKRETDSLDSSSAAPAPPPPPRGPDVYSTIERRIADAIAHAEGFYAPGNPLPRRANNPGDLKNGDVGHGTINDKTIYATVEDGWNALYKQVHLMLEGVSHYYQPTMTIAEMAVVYTGADAASSWAATVADKLGVDTNTTLEDIA